MFEEILYFFIFLFGLAVGSFLNCVIYRLEKNESFLKGRSFCPHCKHKLTWYDLIPLFSFLILKGKCRYCGKKISLQYPLVELATGVLFLSIFNFQFSIHNQFSIFNFQNLLTTSYLLLIACFLIIIFVYDLKHYIIPDKVIYPGIGIVLFYQLFRIWSFGNWNLFRIWDLGFGILPSLFLLAIILISKEEWMGWGDFKLAVFMGLFLGSPKILVALFLSFLIGAIIGLILIITGKKTLKSKVPFAPFLVTGTFLAMFFGEGFINWYLNLLSI